VNVKKKKYDDLADGADHSFARITGSKGVV